MNTNTDRCAGFRSTYETIAELEAICRIARGVSVQAAMEDLTSSEATRDRLRGMYAATAIAHALKAAAAPALYEALRRLDTETTFDDSHAPYCTFNEDDAQAIRHALSLVQSPEGD